MEKVPHCFALHLKVKQVIDKVRRQFASERFIYLPPKNKLETECLKIACQKAGKILTRVCVFVNYFQIHSLLKVLNELFQ